jgi:hypothetical protein
MRKGVLTSLALAKAEPGKEMVDLVPGTFAAAMVLVNKLLPSAAGREGNIARTGGTVNPAGRCRR